MTTATAAAPSIAFDWHRIERELDLHPGLPVNAAWHCSDRICLLGQARKAALLWEDAAGERRSFSFDDLRVHSNALARFLEDLGVRPGERVCLFLDRVPELYLGFLGILKLGAVAQPLFSAFGEESLCTRLADAGTSVVITQRKHLPKVRRARATLPELRQVVVVGAGPLQAGETPLALDDLPRVEHYRAFLGDLETPSVLHYTSGTTGQPKGAQHVHGALVSQYQTTRLVLDLQPDDVYWCNADPGWVTGTSYGILGPWSCGATQVVLDSGFSAERWYRFVQERRVSVWYSAPTAIRLLMREGSELAARFDLRSLRHLASVGEPLNPEAVIWSQQVFGHPFHDTY